VCSPITPIYTSLKRADCIVLEGIRSVEVNDKCWFCVIWSVRYFADFSEDGTEVLDVAAGMLSRA